MRPTWSCPDCEARIYAPEDGAAPRCPFCAEEPAPAAAGPDGDLGIGAELGNYELLSRIGAGGMGVVFRARQKGLDRIVAVKVLNPYVIYGGEEIKRFLREARTVARLQHPCIVPIHEVGADRSFHFYAMDLVEGRPLDAITAEAPLNPHRAARLVAAAARAVQHAHDHGVIHRDLKPSNIMVAPDDTPRILDFGLAKDTRAVSRLTETGATMGTPAYMSPEQAAGAPVDGRTDVYSLGAVLFECLTGRAPFTGTNPYSIVQQVMEHDPPALGSLQAGLPGELQTICGKAMQKDAARRYAGAGALADDLERFLRGDPILGRPPGITFRARRFLRRHAAPVVASAAILLLAAAWFLRPGPDAPDPEARRLVDDARGMIETAAAVRDPGDRARRGAFLADALAALDRAIEAAPDLAEAHYRRGSALRMLYRHAEAVESFTVAIHLDPALRDARYERSLANAELILDEQDSLQAEPDLYRLRLLRADAAALEGARADTVAAMFEVVDSCAVALPELDDGTLLRLAEAERAVARAVEADPADAEARHLQAQLSYLSHEDHPRLIREIEAALQYAPNDVWILGTLVSELLEADRIDDAVARAREIVEIAPELDEARLSLADALNASGDEEGRDAELAEARRVTRRPAYVETIRAMFALDIDNEDAFEDAVDDREAYGEIMAALNRAVEADPACAPARLLRGLLWIADEETDEGRDEVRRYAALSPTMAAHYEDIARFIRGGGTEDLATLRASSDATYDGRLLDLWRADADARDWVITEIARLEARRGSRHGVLRALATLSADGWAGLDGDPDFRGFADDPAWLELKSLR